jgi:endonuclease-3
MNKQKITRIFQRFQAQNPKPTTELNYHSPFELLVAVILSAQATDISVNKATKALFQRANTPEEICQLSLAELEHFIRSIGLYKTKAKNIHKMSAILIAKHHSQVPNTRAALEELPGVGRKTANVILNTVFGEPTIAVDTHLFRVANRTKIAPGKSVAEVELNLYKSIPKRFQNDAHHWLILHGRYVCIARKPRCAQCLIQDLCEFEAKNL